MSEQEIRDRNVRRKSSPGRGNSLVAAHDVSPRAQLLFVGQPLMVALESARLQDTCYQCMRSLSDHSNTGNQQVELKACAGCQTVKFCDRACQKLAWNHHHKYECKIFGKLRPRVLPSTARAVIRFLLKRKQGLVSEDEWKQLFSLQSHMELASKEGGDRWRDLCLMAKAIESYSGTTESLDTILELCCFSAINSFTLTDSSSGRLGVILHPYAALINHSCTPNAYIRFDVPSPSQMAPMGTAINRRAGCHLSIHASEPIKNGTEITVPYIDATLPTPVRQSELLSRYFFTCTCPLCEQGPKAVTDLFLSIPKPPPSTTIEEAQTMALETLCTCDSPSSDTNTAQQITQIRHALSLLSLTKRFPPHRHPIPQLRGHLLGLLITQQTWPEALLQAYYIATTINPTLYPSSHHPLRLVSQWTVYHTAHQQISDLLDANESHCHAHDFRALPNTHRLKLTVSLMINTIKELSEAITPSGYDNGPRSEMSRAIANGMSMEEAFRQQAAREEAAEKRKSGKAAKATGRARTANANGEDRLPPYIGPEAAPNGLPSYEASMAQDEEEDGDENSDAEDEIYEPRSTFGVFENNVTKAFMDLMSGDGSMFWAEYTADRLPGEESVGRYMQGCVREMLEAEERGVAWSLGEGTVSVA